MIKALQGLSITSILLIVAFEMGFGLKFNFVGQISVSELFVVGYTLIFLASNKLLRTKEFKRIALLYLFLLLSQILSELMVENTLQNSLRGFSVTIVSFCHLFFVLTYLMKDRRYIVFFILGIILYYIFFVSTGELIAESSVNDDDMGAIYIKFYLAPLLTNIVLIISLFFQKKISDGIFIVMSLAFVVLGARSSGAMAFLAGVTAFFLWGKNQRKASIHIKRWIIPILLLSYGGYCIYVQEVLDGNIKAGNNEQLFRAANPYNPINLLSTGRPETFTGIVAFIDSPLFGHGAWCSDAQYGYKYHQIVADFSGIRYNPAAGFNDAIPSHSVIVGYAMQNGIAALILIVSIFVFFVKIAVKNLKHRDDKYLLITIMFLCELLWNCLFSPYSHFRLSLPLYMAFFLATYLDYKKVNKSES